MDTNKHSDKASKIYSLITILLILLSSCIVTEKQRKKICNTCPSKIEIKDSIIEKIVEKPFALPPIQGPIVYLDNPCKELCDSLGNLKPVNKTYEKNGIRTSITTKGNTVLINSNTDTIKGKVSVKEKQSFSEEKKVVKEYIPCTNERTSFDGFCRWYLYITFPIIILLILVKYRKKIFNFVAWLK